MRYDRCNTVSHQFGAPTREVIVEHHSPAGPLITSVRGSLLVTAIERLKECGHFERYLTKLPARYHEQMLYALAVSWVPVELMMEHCKACDDLCLSDAELVQLGSETARTMSRAMLGTMLRTAGISPLLALASLGRVWDRIYIGGSCTVLRTGPKDVFLEQNGNLLAGSRYLRIASQGFFKSLAELFSTKAYVKAARPRQPSPLAFALEGSWV